MIAHGLPLSECFGCFVQGTFLITLEGTLLGGETQGNKGTNFKVFGYLF